jgi:hypothetical protein
LLSSGESGDLSQTTHHCDITDNIGAIITKENPYPRVRIRYIDTRYHFICENVEGGFIKIIFVRTNKNDADTFTKNVNKETYEKNGLKFLGKW